jgi:glucose-1-phosphate thymidylyltransferase
MQIVVFEDKAVARLYPVTIGRPAMAISCGSYRLADLVARLGPPVRISVRRHLRHLCEADYPQWTAHGEADSGPLLLVNARLVPAVNVLERLRAMLADGRPAVVRSGEAVAAALVAPDGPRPPRDVEEHGWDEYLCALPSDGTESALPLFDYPHDILRHHAETLADNLQDRLSGGHYREIADGVFAAEGAKLGQHVVADSRQGPILLEEAASIGPYCYLSGPAYIGAGSRVIEHSAIKDGVSLGQTTKVGGEVECSTIEPYTNKQHHGFIGHSYLGSWVNLGAGTSNSDLKNTYGQVTMEYHGRKVSTGMQFVGCIIGDYAKTAVNTSIFTGKTIGVCSMVYGFVTTNVPSFVNYARSFGQITEAPVDVMVAAQGRMFKRRNVTQRPCDIQLLRDMYELTRHERQLANEPLSL